MTFKEFALATLKFPAKVFTFATSLVLGGTLYMKDDPYAENGETAVTIRGLVGLVADGARGFSNFLRRHHTAIGAAAWISAATMLTVGLIVGLWPLALATVAGFSIAGVSIASVVGASAIAQIAAIVGLSGLAASVATYVVAGVTNSVIAIKDYVADRRAQQVEEVDSDNENENEHNTVPHMQRRPLRGPNYVESGAPVHTPSVFVPATNVRGAPTNTVVVEEVNSTVTFGQ